MPLTVTSRSLYLILLFFVLADVVLLCTSRATLDLSEPSDLFWRLSSTAAFAMMFVVFSMRAATLGAVGRSIKYFAEAGLFLSLVQMFLPLFNHLTMMLPFPLQDDLLSGLDRSIGFNWLAYFEFVHAYPTLIKILEFCYVQLSYVGLIALIALALLGDPRRVRFYVEVFFLTGVIAIVIGAGFPALAAVHLYVGDLSAYPNFPSPPGVYHLPHLELLRDADAAVPLDPVGLPGLVTFPSYHTASGILLCVVFFRTWLFVPFTTYSLLMIASSPVFGAHYLIDIIAGAILSVAVVWYLLGLPRYHGLFAQNARDERTAALLT
ncbi:phosphatase PAP2 family protein [Roseovarius sp. CAU 1744]|uniref:phosphatase PAP2 family protein n=1 Tax=Roseovarius sp. CAU 1744 TaxID=3140368 RepID=UPI00325A9AE8